MKTLLFISTLIASYSCNAGNCSKQELTEEFDSPITYMDEYSDENISFDEQLGSATLMRSEKKELYNNELNIFLSQSDDIKIQLSAFENLLFDTSNGQNTNTNKIKEILTTAISPSSDRYTIFLADSLCHNNVKLTDWCHQQQIHEIHRDIDPENIHTYLFGLNEDENIEKLQEVLDEAAGSSTYSNSFFFEYTLESAQKIEYFNDANPELFIEFSSRKTPGDYIQEMKSTVSSKNLIGKGIVPDDFILKLNESTSIIHAIGNEMARTLSFSAIVQACQGLGNSDSCLQIGNLLMKDKTLINQLIGSAIIVETQKKLTTDKNIINKSKTLMDKIYKEYTCYIQIEDVSYAMMSNKKMIMQYILDAKKFGELESSKKLAFNVYNTIKQHGYNPDFNPNDCK